MIFFAFDIINSGVAVPNLRNTNDNPELYETTAPYSKDFGFLNYLNAECIPYTQLTVAELAGAPHTAVYPIHLTHFDSSIDYVAAMSEQARQMSASGQLLPLFYFSHGIDVTAVYAHLLPLLTKYGIEHSNLRVILPNLTSNRQDLIHFSDYESQAHYTALETDIVHHVNVRNRHKTFVCSTEHDSNFGSLIAGSMWYHGLHLNGYFSYKGAKQLNDPNKGGTNVLKWNKYWADVDELLENFKLHVPFNLAEPIEKPTTLYSDAYWGVVIANQCDKTHAHIPRGVFNPIMNMQPFMVVGPQYTLRTLRDMGYVTFSEWMDEGYDKIKSDEERMNICFQMIYDIANLTHKEHTQMMKEMIPVLAHNQGVLLSSKKEQYLAAINMLMGTKI
ncbi:hypothetical protein UFOVP116_368 [uncultured Caudovirales phage]|uniref:Uncharacterized protein n=1 Tax=uncultured Caudovirales phage TaxID=2100421 RepID=A0A6J5LB74_9CAUD|nr:hypothetical protein UFOVP116_368 [uncultured Caudovirales phage]